MKHGAERVNPALGFTLALVTVVAAACASGGAAGGDDMGGGRRPADNTHTRAAGVALAQAALAEGPQSEDRYRTALEHAIASIEAEPANARGPLLAGQAYVGLADWAGADTMFDRALQLFPGYEEQISSEREQAWVNAYNMGIEAVNAGDIEGGLAHFQAADLMYQRRAEARMNVAWAHMQLGDTQAAAEAYLRALEILYAPPPEGLEEEQVAQWGEDRRVAALNAAQLLSQTGQHRRAAEVLGDFMERAGPLDPELELQVLTAQATFLAQAGDVQQAEEIYGRVIDREGLSANDYFQIGVGLFNAEDYARAADAFRSAVELNPYSRDALFNLVQALYTRTEEVSTEPESAERDRRLREMYTEIADAAERVREFDPLNRNLLSFMLRAHRGLAMLSSGAEAERHNQRSQDIFRTYQAQQFEVSDISLAMQRGDRVEIGGVLQNVSATPGSQVQLRFSILGPDGRVAESATVRVQAPAQNEAVEFTTQLRAPSDFAGWKYEIVQ